jgi:predicted phosphodiesterase
MAQKLRLAIIGDPHLAVPHGPDDQRIEIDRGLKLHGESKRLLEAAISAVNAEPELDAVLLLGDMTRDGELFNHEAAAELMADCKAPLYILAGNHDYLRERRAGISYGTQRLDKAEFADFWRGRGFPDGQTSYKVELRGGVDLIAVDSNLTLAELSSRGFPVHMQDHGFVTDEVLAWLDTALAETRARGRLPLVAAHHSVLDHSPAERDGHPLLSIFGFWQVRPGEALRTVLEKHRVPLVVSGHLHIQSVNTDSGLTNLVCAALVSYPHTWGVLTVADGGIEYESRSLAEYLPASFIETSRAGSNQGIKELIMREVANHPLAASHAAGIAEMVAKSDWWPRLSDGTLAGFKVDTGLLPRNPLARIAYAKVAGILDEYGEWKAKRGDPNRVRIDL